jgi:hypothetical protein
MLRRCLLPLTVALVACRSHGPGVTPAVTGLTGAVTAMVPVPGHTDSASVEFLLPPGDERIRGVVVFVNRGIDEHAFDNREWRAMCARARCAMMRLLMPMQEDSVRPPAQLIRNAAVGGGQTLLTVLARLARESGHPELADAGVLLWGFSAAGNFGPTFAQWRPDRTLGYVSYHSHMRGIPVDVPRIAGIPALFIAGGADSLAGVEDAERSWRAGRAANAPYAFVVHPRRVHVTVEGLLDASHLMRGWIEAVLSARGPADGAGSGSTSLRPIRREAGWLANAVTGEIARNADYAGDRAAASWLPDEATAMEWLALQGGCASITPDVLARSLDEGARRTEERSGMCQYTVHGTDGAASTLWLWLGRNESVSSAQQGFDAQRREPGSTPLEGMRGRGFVQVDAQSKCRLVVAHRATFVIRARRCGPGYDSESVRRALEELTVRLAGRG